MSDEIQQGTPAAAPEAAPVATPAPAPEAPKESFAQTLDRVADEVINGKRGPDGKYQSRVVAQGAPETAELPGGPQAATPEPALPAIDAPQSLPDDVKKQWSTLPRAIQEVWSKRESEAHSKITADGERLKSLGAFEEVAKSLEPRLKQVNAPASEYFRRLAAADQLLATDGVRGLQQIAQMYGIDLRAALQQPPAQPISPTDIDARINQGIEQRFQQITLAEKAADIDKFRTSLPEDERGDFDRLESVMVGLASAMRGKSVADLYKAARKVDAEASAKDEAKAKAEADKKAQEEAKAKAAKDAKIGPLSHKPGSSPTAPIKGKDFWGTFANVAKEVVSRS